MSRRERSHCPIAFALDIFGDQWSLLILRDLIFKDKRLYSEFLESEEGIATNVLANRLARLLELGLITRSRDPENMKQWIYTPTSKSLDLVPMMLEMIRWSYKHDRKSAAPEEFIDSLERDPKELIAGILSQFSRRQEIVKKKGSVPSKDRRKRRL